VIYFICCFEMRKICEALTHKKRKISEVFVEEVHDVLFRNQGEKLFQLS